MPSILFSAGDLSGDEHTARVMALLQAHHTNWSQFAVGGAAMKATGATMIGDSRGSGVIGLVPALQLVPRLLQLRNRVLDWCRKHRPSLVVMCDWGAFNARLLKPLQELKIPVLYYFPPSSWRKRGTRGLGIAPYVQRVATPFEWSAQRLREAGCNAEWVGHPVLESLRPIEDRSIEKQSLRASFDVRGDDKLIALLPGSRALELRYIAPHLRDAARSITSQTSTRSNFRFVIGAATGTTMKVRQTFSNEFSVVEGRTGDLLMACDAAVVKSGTSTLEAAVAGAPQVVVYDGPPILEWQWKLMGGTKKTPFVAMPNIIAERQIVRELLADKCRAQNIINELTQLLGNNETLRDDYACVRRALGSELGHSATERTCQIIEEMMT